MAEALKRWDGMQWVTVTSINRIMVETGEGGFPLVVTSGVYENTAANKINPISGLGVSYDYTIE